MPCISLSESLCFLARECSLSMMVFSFSTSSGERGGWGKRQDWKVSYFRKAKRSWLSSSIRIVA